jgi:3-oxoadipate enol-lactonase / 4-carboxymuconolactone decarboxylase
MAEALVKGERVAYDLTGTEPAPVLVLLASLGTDRQVWEAQVPAFSSWFRVLRIDHPGHYGPSAPMGARSLEALGERIIGVLDSLDVESAHFAGLSLGGLIAMKLAIDHPGRVARLAVCCSAPRFAPSGMWVERAEKVRAEGIAPLVEAALGRWFGPAFWRHHPEVVARYRSMLSGVDPEGYASCCDALAAADVSGQLGQITAPTLVLGGANDPVVPPESAASTMAAIPGASLCVLAGAAHLANVEQPGAFNSAVLAHLAGRPDERGVAVRRAVLGADHVERSMSGASELTAPFQEMLNLWPWGEVWARPGLDVETRRLIAIAILVALGRHGELEMHLRQAMRAGTSLTALRELLLQTAVYAGVPAANSAFAIADRVWTEVTKSAGAGSGDGDAGAGDAGAGGAGPGGAGPGGAGPGGAGPTRP